MTPQRLLSYCPCSALLLLRLTDREDKRHISVSREIFLRLGTATAGVAMSNQSYTILLYETELRLSKTTIELAGSCCQAQVQVPGLLKVRPIKRTFFGGHPEQYRFL